MAKRGTAGFGLVIAAALIIFAILAPGTPERPQPETNVISGSGLLAQRGAYGAALGGQAGTASLTPVPSQEELEKLITDYLAQATTDVQAQVAALLPQYIAGAQADIQAQISTIAAQFQGRGLTADQVLASLLNALPSRAGPSGEQLSKLLAPRLKEGALKVPSGGKAAPAAPQAPPAQVPSGVKPAKPAREFGLDPGDMGSGLESDMGKMDSKLDSMDFDTTDMD